ncbi:MAG: Fe-S protein assembly co-chaperone HscB [Acidobacteriaceae bacterium]|jgi:molecular chaperone HscB|nr:Fe-S protein assembly co-chaperone HscB [Acidobacteriaceae bacterium]
MSSTPTSIIQVCRSCGGGSPVAAHFCQQCTKILTLGRHGDYFAFLGLPRTLTIAPALLEQQFRALSRQFHPDYFYNATPAERRASLERSSYLNDAFRTLKHPVQRIVYLLEIEGVLTPAERGGAVASATVPPDLLEEVFALNEELDEVRALKASGAPDAQWREKLQHAAAPIAAKRDAHARDLAALASAWDAVADRPADAPERRQVLQALRARVLERNYINNLLATIEREGLQVSGEAEA